MTSNLNREYLAFQSREDSRQDVGFSGVVFVLFFEIIETRHMENEQFA